IMIFVLISCEDKKITETELSEESLSSFVLRNYEESQLKWKLTAEEAKISDTTVIYNLKLVFFYENLQPSSTLKADSGYFVQKTNDLKAMGHIFVESSDSVNLWTEELNYSEEKQKIFTDKEVKYTKENETYMGRGLESDPELEHIVIKEEFSGKGDFE
ncbi:MAG: LPS export ABC transporter periplasmic protein LptC, partial [candidate division WOR-3 bacterium]